LAVWQDGQGGILCGRHRESASGKTCDLRFVTAIQDMTAVFQHYYRFAIVNLLTHFSRRKAPYCCPCTSFRSFSGRNLIEKTLGRVKLYPVEREIFSRIEGD
jgi:hypothetical protein